MKRTYIIGLIGIGALLVGVAVAVVLESQWTEGEAETDVKQPVANETEQGIKNNGTGESNSEKIIEIDLTEQRLRAFEGKKLVYDFIISSGMRDKTPTGTFRIWKKYRIKDMDVGVKVLDKYYTLRNVPFVMYYFNEEVPKTRGFAIHGAYWHRDFGRPTSHGCVNMKVEEAEKLFNWAGPDIHDRSFIVESDDNPGTEVVIYGDPPK